MITQHTKYGLKALLALGRKYPDQQLTTIAQLAEEERIPAKFLEIILLEMKNLGWLHAKRGPGGGYALAKSPREIRLGDVLRQMEGPVALVPCARAKAGGLCEDCAHRPQCAVRMLMKEVRDAAAAVLDRTSLDTLLEEERMYGQEDEAPMYYI